MNQPMKLTFCFFAMIWLVGCAPQAVRQPQTIAMTPVAAVNAGTPLRDDLSRYHALLTDPDEGIQIAAARVLIEHGDLTGKAVLLAALHHDDVHHRIDAALALEQIPDAETVVALQQAFKTERHPLVQTILKQALKRVAQ